MMPVKILLMVRLLERCPHVLTTATAERKDPQDVAAELALWADAIIEAADTSAALAEAEAGPAEDPDERCSVCRRPLHQIEIDRCLGRCVDHREDP